MPQRPGRPNLLDQDFTCEGTDQKWGVDISYIWTAEGWLYLAIVLDLYSRRIVGWATSDRLKKDLAMSALRRAIALRQPMPGLIHHSDRGGQYCSHDYQNLLKAHGMTASMSGKGNSLIMPWSRPCSKRSKPKWSGERAFKLEQPQNWPLADTSMASTIPVGDTPHWDIKRRYHSRP